MIDVRRRGRGPLPVVVAAAGAFAICASVWACGEGVGGAGGEAGAAQEVDAGGAEVVTQDAGETELSQQDAGAGSDGGSVPATAVTTSCVGADEPTHQPYSNQLPQEPLCVEPDTVALPKTAHLVDLSNLGPDSPSACRGFLPGPESPHVLDAELGFPQVLRLPAVQAADPACAKLCDLGPETTAFGLTVVYPELVLAGKNEVLLIRVPAPWFLVIGNEHSPSPCLDGRPSILEYGRPLACAATWGNHVGFATADASAPSVDVLMDVVGFEDLPNTPFCCPYVCD